MHTIYSSIEGNILSQEFDISALSTSYTDSIDASLYFLMFSFVYIKTKLEGW